MEITLDPDQLEALVYVTGEKKLGPLIFDLMKKEGEGEHGFAQFYEKHWDTIWNLTIQSADQAIKDLDEKGRKDLFYMHQDEALAALERHDLFISYTKVHVSALVMLMAEMLHAEVVAPMVENDRPVL